MPLARKAVVATVVVVSYIGIAPLTPAARGAADPQAQSTGQQRIDLAQLLGAGKLRAINRDVTTLGEKPDAVRVGEGPGPGIVWIDGNAFGEGTIELDVRGRDVLQQSFVGIAFHGKDNETYESVYLRPFNFRTDDAQRRAHAIQYIAAPEYDWPRLRKEFPGEFEQPVDSTVAPTDWVPLRVVVQGRTIRSYVGRDASPTLEVRKLGQQEHGMIGLWVGNSSNGDFANMRVTPAK